MTDLPNGYSIGFTDGRKAMFHEILCTIGGEIHPTECRCDPCQVVHLVMEQYLGTIREMLGEEAVNNQDL